MDDDAKLRVYLHQQEQAEEMQRMEHEKCLHKALKELLESGLLYKSVTVRIDGVEKDIFSHRWAFKFAIARKDADSTKENFHTLFGSPIINIPCNSCDAITPPHHSGYSTNKHAVCNGHTFFNSQGDTVQIFDLPYTCQNCQEGPVVFLVRREGAKIQLVGQSHFPRIVTPNYIPKHLKGYYEEAQIAYRAGRILAALFFLRTLIEQHMRFACSRLKDKIDGEKLADEYSKLLDPDFPSKIPRLKLPYNHLSVCLHSADANEKVFIQSLTEIELHFQQLKILPLRESKKDSKQKC